jgi:hypothetical protein
MPKIDRKDWEDLRNIHKAAFTCMPEDLFKLLLDKIYGNPGTGSANPGTVDKIDALMVYLCRGEPPIQP